MQIAVETDVGKHLEEVKKIITTIKELEETKKGLCFLTVGEIVSKAILPWSKKTVQDLFNRPDFPSCDYGKEKVVEVTAFRKYFEVPRRK